MTKFNVSWKVIEVVNGSGSTVVDGARRTIARGHVQFKEAESADALRAELTKVLETAFPPFAQGPTYDLLRSYDITITGSV